MKKIFLLTFILCFLSFAAVGCNKNNTENEDGYYAVYNTDAKFGFIDQSGKIIIDYQYDGARSFSEGLAAVRKGDKYGYIDKNGKVVIDFLYKEAYDFREGLACVMNDKDLYGYITPDGDVNIDFQFKSKSNFSEGLAYVRNNKNLYGYIDAKGEVVIPFSYSGVQSFSDGLALVWNYEDQKAIYKYIDKTGKVIITPDCAAATSFHDGKAAVQNDINKWHYIDKTGKELSEIPEKYKTLAPVRCGLALAQKQDKWGYINTKGKQVIKCSYDYAESFINGLAFVSNSDEKTAEAFIINTKGDVVYTYPEIDLTKSAEPEAQLTDDETADDTVAEEASAE